MDQNQAPSYIAQSIDETERGDIRALKIVARISWIYLALSCLSAIYIPLSIAISSSAPIDGTTPGSACINLLVFITAFIGLKRRHSWAPSFVLLLSAVSLIYSAIQMLEPSQVLLDVIGKFITLCMMAFFMYQIILFYRPGVRRLFKAEGLDLY